VGSPDFWKPFGSLKSASYQLDPARWLVYVQTMAKRQNTDTPKSPRELREDRLKAALKENIKRRKDQAKARETDGSDTSA